MADFENRLWATAVQSAETAGMELTVPCSHNVRDLIGAGVAAMRRENRLSEGDLEAADAALGRVAGEMVRVTRGLGAGAASGAKTVIREGALVEAKKLPRLWPFA